VKKLVQPVISIKNIHFHYHDDDKREALSDVSIDVYPGEWLAIIGHNGSGKSTLAKMMNGLLEPNEGSIYIDGQLLTEETVYEARRKVGMVFQNPDNQFVGTTVEDDIAFGLENIGMPRVEMIQKINSSLEMVRMTPFKDKEPARLSGGQKQRVASARAIVTNPKLVLADEPTGALDSKSSRMLLERFDYLNQELGATILMVTHDAFTASYSSRVIFIKDGKIFNEINRGKDSRKEFFDKIIDVMTLLGGDLGDAL